MKTIEEKSIPGRISTYSGKWFYPLDPKPEDIDPIDICHALSNQCRFTGHTRSFYSVAEHSCRVHDILSPENRKWGLLHDATEAYLVDLPRPLKAMEELNIFSEVEDKIMKAICEKFNLNSKMPREVKAADNILLYTEIRDLMMFQPSYNGFQTLDQTIFPWSPAMAKLEMEYRMKMLGIEVK